MRRLDLDFHRTRPASRWASWALLAIAVAFAADVGLTYDQLREGVAWKEARLAKRGGAAAASGPGAMQARAVSLEEIAAARETIQRLSTPWEKLFAALESTPTDDVALLAIDPDPKAGTVTISGQGKDYPAALQYAAELGQAGALSRVYLVRHELRQNDPQRPVAFSVSASWRGAK